MSKTNPLVSIIVPTYKRPDFLKKTLESLLRQTHKNIEIIVVNNYPQKPVKEIVNQFDDQRIKLYQENKKGSSHARNKGIKKASGDYICFCDDDDLFLPQKVEKQFGFMKRNPNFSFSYHNYYFKKGKEKKIGAPPNAPTNAVDLLLTNYLAAPIHTLMIKKKCLKEVEFDTQLKGSEDADLLKKLALNHKFGFLNKPLVIYQLHDQNKKKKKRVEYFIADKKVNSKYIKKLLKQKLQSKYSLETIKRLKIKLHYHQGLIYYYQFKFKLARKEFLGFIKKKPICFWPYFYLVTSFLGKSLIKKNILPNLANIEYFVFKIKKFLKII